MVPPPTHGVLGQIEGQPALRGQPPGERVSSERRGIGVGANIYPVTGFGLPLHGPASRVSPLEAVERIAPDEFLVPRADGIEDLAGLFPTAGQVGRRETHGGGES